ncbi:hypothetical protein GCM10027167_19900 [Nocardia heshunensis]
MRDRVEAALRGDVGGDAVIGRREGANRTGIDREIGHVSAPQSSWTCGAEYNPSIVQPGVVSVASPHFAPPVRIGM